MLLFLQLILVFFLLVVIYLVIPAIIKILLRRQFLTNVDQDGKVYLTFDDGPNPEATPLLLDVLKRHKVRATFFVTGEMAAQFPEIVQRICDEGHGLGGHSYSHCHPWKTGPLTSLFDMIKGRRVIKGYIGSQKPMLFRPPYGKFNFVTLCYVFLTKQKVVFWNNDPKDYSKVAPEQVVEEILQNIPDRRVVLMHDGGSIDSWLVRKDITVVAVDALISTPECQHFQFNIVDS